MRNWYGIPPSVNQEMMMSLRYRLGNVLGVSFLFQVLSVYRASGPEPDGGDDVQFFQTVGTSIVLGMYVLVPLRRCRGFEKFDQMEDCDTDLAPGEGDTRGLTFE